MNKHKHYEYIIAWAEGKEIQFLNGNNWITTNFPSWDNESQYRVKKQIWEPKIGDWQINMESLALASLQRINEEASNAACNELTSFCLLLAYRDEFDPDYVYNSHEDNYYIYRNYYANSWDFSYDGDCPNLCKVYMSGDVAKALVKKLNSGEVVI